MRWSEGWQDLERLEIAWWQVLRSMDVFFCIFFSYLANHKDGEKVWNEEKNRYQGYCKVRHFERRPLWMPSIFQAYRVSRKAANRNIRVFQLKSIEETSKSPKTNSGFFRLEVWSSLYGWWLLERSSLWWALAAEQSDDFSSFRLVHQWTFWFLANTTRTQNEKLEMLDSEDWLCLEFLGYCTGHGAGGDCEHLHIAHWLPTFSNAE